jgi:Transposase IS66 family
VVTRYEIQIGRCVGCRRRIQPRHPEQTSDALGAAGVQVGPRAVALAVWLSKGLGLPAAKVARLLGQLGLKVTPGGVVQTLARAARRATPTYVALVGGVRASPVVAPDETGWRVAGRRAWLWAFAGKGVVVYRIASGRGFHDAKVVLGGDYAGVLERDGWAPTGSSPRRRIRHAWRTCCVAAPSCWMMPSAARPRPRMRSVASSKLPWRSASSVTPASWTPPRSPARPSGWARRSTGSSPGRRCTHPTGGCWTI